MHQIYAFLSAVSVVLLIPVILFLLVTAFVVLWQLGAVAYEAWLRRRTAGSYRTTLSRLQCAGTVDAIGLERAVTGPRLLREWLSRCAAEGDVLAATPPDGSAEAAQRALDLVELSAMVRLEQLRLLARLGPALGLMGTLIPLGPALVALAQGDLQTLAENLVVAFGTTVAGLFVAVLAQLLATVRARWYAEDLLDLEHLTTRANRQQQPRHHGTSWEARNGFANSSRGDGEREPAAGKLAGNEP